MARKPAPGLPDVFAKPGGAPGRGTAIEDLPQPVAKPVPEPLAETPPPAPVIEEPPPETDQWADSEAPPPPAPSSGRRTLIVAIAAIVITITAPYWEADVLSVLGIRTPVEQLAEENVLAITRQEQRAADIEQRLAATTAQIAKLQAALVGTSQQAQQVASLTSMMALVRLSDTLRRPVPFAAELAVARASGASLGDLQPLLDKIEPYSATGIPGVVQLRQDFAVLYNQVTRAQRGLLPTEWISNLAVWTHLRSAPPPSQPADPSLDLLRTASVELADGDVAAALAQTRQLGETYRPVFANWQDDAQARAAAETLAERVSDMVAKVLRPAAASK